MAYLPDKDQLDVEFRKVVFEPSADSMLKTDIESQQGDFFKQQQEIFCETFNPDDFRKKISPILDKAIEEKQKCEKQMQDYIKQLKSTGQGSRIMNEIINRLAKLYEKMKHDYKNGEIPSIYDIEEIETIRVVLETVYMREEKYGEKY